jgi:hypothetical protein
MFRVEEQVEQETSVKADGKADRLLSRWFLTRLII